MCWLLNLLGSDTCQFHLHMGWPKLATESLLSLIGWECKQFLVRNDPESLPDSVKIHCVNLFVCLFFKKSFYLFFGPHCLAHGILIPQPGIKRMPPPVEAWSLNHWTNREVLPVCKSYTINFMNNNNTYSSKVLGAVLSSLHKLSHWTLRTTLWGREYYYSHFTGGESEALSS